MTLLKSIREASEENIAWLGDVYLDVAAIPARRTFVLDALIEHGSEAAQLAIVTHVRDSLL